MEEWTQKQNGTVFFVSFSNLRSIYGLENEELQTETKDLLKEVSEAKSMRKTIKRSQGLSNHTVGTWKSSFCPGSTWHACGGGKFYCCPIQ